MTRFKENVERIRVCEMFAALIEIQRVWRGTTCRIRLLNYKKLRAVMDMQRVYRGHRNRIHEVKDRLEEVKRIKYAALIARNWIAVKKARAYRARSIIKYQSKKCMIIQKIWRGSRGRILFQKQVIHHLQNVGAIKMQSLFRRYQAVLLFDRMFLARSRLQAVVQMQRIIRGLSDRIVKYSV